MHETALRRASSDATGSRQGVATREVPETLRDALQAQLARATTALSEAEARHQSAMAAAAEQLADQKAAYELAMARNTAIWAMVDEQLREAALEVERARQSQSAAVAAVDRATRRAAELETQIAGELETRQHLEQALARTAQDHQDAETRHTTAMAAVAARADELESALRHASEVGESRAAEILRLAEQEADVTSQLAQAVTSRAAIERQHRAVQDAIHDADVRATRERLAACQKAAEREAELDGQLRLERDARAALERAAADAESAARVERERFEQELSEATSSRDAAADRLHSTEAALEDLRCHHESEMAGAVRSSQQREAELVERVSGQEAIIEVLTRQVAEGASERSTFSSELDAVRHRLETAEREAGQLPRLRERLELAHRMEAVGRLASEAATTCGNILADVHQNVQQWLMATNGDAVMRQRGETVLDDVTHVAGVIRQLAGYVDENGREPAEDLGSILRDLEPVLRRVAGQDVEIRLPQDVAPRRLDLSSERVERLLTGLASYGRERVPDGGRLTIELGTVILDREFTARHPNMRAGAHALITMTRSRSGDADPLRNRPGHRPRGRAGKTAGVELGTLQSQVGECGGYLWMTIDPQGDMVSKLHLPLPGENSDGQ